MMANEKLSEERVKHIILRVIENANRSLEKHKKHPEDEFRDGHSLAYYEVLSTIQSELLAADQDLAQFGLDMKLEKKFL